MLQGRFLEVDGARLYAEWPRAPVAGAPVLVFLHDGLGSIETWRAFPRLLAEETGLGAFAYDRWGYGRSDARAAFPDFLMADAAERLPRVLAAAGIDDHVVIGHSDGGTIALLHGATDPAGLRGLVSISAHVHGDAATAGQLRRLRKCLDEDDVPAWIPRFHGEKGAALLEGWVETWSRAFGAGWDVTREIAAIVKPLFVIHGSEDEYGLPVQIGSIGRAVPNAKARLLPGVGHFPHLADPKAIVGIVKAFLDADVL